MPTPTLRPAGDEPLPNRGDTDRTFSDVRENVFETVVEENSNVCSRCFFRHRQREERPNTAGNEKRARRSSHISYEVPERPMMDELDWRYYETETLQDRLGYDHIPDEVGGGEYATVDGGEERYCQNCGFFDTSTAERSRTKLKAVQAAFTLSRTLKEYEIPHDPRHLVETVRGLKGTSPLNSNDARVFEIATETAVELAERGLTESAWKPTHD